MSVPILPLYNIVRRPSLPEHLVQVLDQILGLFVRGEVSTSFVFRIEYFVAYGIEPAWGGDLS